MHTKTSTDKTLRLAKGNMSEKISKILTMSVPILMGIFLFFNPFPHTTAIKEICFYSSLFIVLILISFRQIGFSFQSPVTIPFLFFVIWVFVGLFFALDRENSIHDFFTHLLKYLALYYLLVNFFASKKRFEILSWVIIISTAFFSLGAMIYFYLLSGHPISERLGASFLELHVDYIGFVTLFPILLSLDRFNGKTSAYTKVILLVCLLVTSMATLLTQSRGTLAAAVIAFIILFPKKKKTLIVFSILFLIGAGITPGLTNRLDLTKALNDVRIGINLTTYEIIKSHPVIGIGFGMETYGNKNLLDLEKYNARVPPQYRQKRIITAPHNVFLDIAVRTGLVGIALYIYILFVFVRMGWKIIRHGKDNFIRDRGFCIMAAFVGIIVQGIFADGMFGPQAIVLFTIFAMITILFGLRDDITGLPADE